MGWVAPFFMSGDRVGARVLSFAERGRGVILA